MHKGGLGQGNHKVVNFSKRITVLFSFNPFFLSFTASFCRCIVIVWLRSEFKLFYCTNKMDKGKKNPHLNILCSGSERQEELLMSNIQNKVNLEMVDGWDWGEGRGGTRWQHSRSCYI